MKRGMEIAGLLAVLCCAHLAFGEIHSLKYFYTASAEIQDFPEFVVVAMVDEVQFVHYDSDSKKAVPKQDWIEKNANSQYWERETGIFLGASQNFKANIDIAKSRFNQTGGVHTFQNMYGCQWDDETGAIDGYHQYGYDGEDFISLDLKAQRWIAPLRQSEITKHKWDADRAMTEYWAKQYHGKYCIDWLKKYVQYGSSTLGRKVPPQVSLLQKGSEMVCHATGFYPEGVMITWKKDGEEMQDDVDVGETLPNEDGTFQKRAVLTVSAEERKKGNYTCEVTHKSGTFMPKEPRKVPGTEPSPSGLIPGVVIGVLLLIALVALAGFLWWKKGNSGFGPVNTKDDASASSDETQQKV
ncbi:hypothetical protein ACEWY4_023965 [Coilia grayii]|uniref:Ig-like domain-containing protein n=1 Tax=Coilia grayii TaxID=363190 RepID=A0ABD1IZA9_9TELE